MLLREAKKQGVQHMVVNHPIQSTLAIWTLAQLQEAVKLGALIEAPTRMFISGATDARQTGAETVRKLGVENCILSSDSDGSPLHPDALALAAKWLRSQGFTDQELNRMMKDNPARLLGLPPQ